jgi:type IV secretory pathway VirB10-like protein
MVMNRAALGALAVAGIVAIAGGTYLASRPAAPVSEDLTAATASQPGDSASVPAVTETENSITPAAAPSAATAVPATPVRQATSVEKSPARVRETASAPAVRTERRAAPSRPAPPAVNAAERSAGAPAASIPADPPVAPAIEPVESTTVENVPAAPEAPKRMFEDLVISADSVIGLQLETAVSSELAKVEDVVKARVTRDVKVGEHVAIPAGTRAEGSVTLVEKGGRLKDRARLGIRFHSMVLSDGTRLAVNTETIYRDGESPARESATKIGAAAIGGAVLGAVLGGKKGAAIGGAVGAAGGGAAVMASEANPATVAAGSTVTVRMSAPVTVTVEK